MATQQCLDEFNAREFTAQNLANVAWAFAAADMPDQLLFVALPRLAKHRLSNISAQNIANMLWAFATIDRSDALLFASLASAAKERLWEFGAQSLVNTI